MYNSKLRLIIKFMPKIKELKILNSQILKKLKNLKEEFNDAANTG